MSSRADVITATKQVLSDMKRIEAEEIDLEDRLDEDLQIDSMDAVDLVVDLKMKLGVKLGGDDIKNVEKVEDIVDQACQKLDDRS